MNRLLLLWLLSVAVYTAPSLADQKSMSLDEFLKVVTERNLDLKIERAKTDFFDAKSTGLSIPPPMIGMNQMTEDSGRISRGFEINQSIPFPTKLTGDHSARQYEAKAQSEMQRAKSNEIIADAKLIFLSLWADQERVALLQEKRKILDDHIKLSRSTARSDSFAAIHLLKSESERDLLENEIFEANQLLKEQQAEIASLLNYSLNEFQPNAVEPPISEIPEALKDEEAPKLRSLKFDIESAKSRETEAVSAWFPDLDFKYKQMGATDMAGPYKEFMIGVTVPFAFFWEPYSQNRAAGAERIRKEYEYEKESRALSNKKETLISKVKSLKTELDSIREKLIPRAEKRVMAVHNLAPRDMETLQDHRETMEALPNLKLKNLDLRIQYETAIAEVVRFFGDYTHDKK